MRCGSEVQRRWRLFCFQKMSSVALQLVAGSKQAIFQIQLCRFFRHNAFLLIVPTNTGGPISIDSLPHRHYSSGRIIVARI